MGCTYAALFEYITQRLKDGMTWDNYGSEWCFSNMESPKEYDLNNSDQFMSYFNYKSFAPVSNAQLEGIGSKAQGWPVLRTGEPVSPSSSKKRK